MEHYKVCVREWASAWRGAVQDLELISNPSLSDGESDHCAQDLKTLEEADERLIQLEGTEIPDVLQNYLAKRSVFQNSFSLLKAAPFRYLKASWEFFQAVDALLEYDKILLL